MLRKRDWIIGALGILMLVGGVVVFLSDRLGVFPLWFAWLVAPVLWYTGFLAAVAWFLTRVFGSRNKDTNDPLTKSGPVRH